MSRRWPDPRSVAPKPYTFVDWFLIGLTSVIVTAILLAFFSLFLLIAPAHARWKPEYANAPKAIRDWYQNAELTEAARKRLNWTKCCDHADVVKTKFKVNKTNGEDQWLWLDGDQWRVVPPDIIHYDKKAPGSQPVLFVYKETPTCFFLPDGGI